MMNSMELHTLAEGIKDRYTTIFKYDEKFKCSQGAIDEAGDLIAQMISNFNELKADKGLEHAIHYLADTAGYYAILCSDIQKTNQELLDLLKEWRG